LALLGWRGRTEAPLLEGRISRAAAGPLEFAGLSPRKVGDLVGLRADVISTVEVEYAFSAAVVARERSFLDG